MSKGGGEANKDALPATPLPSDATAYPSIDVQVRRRPRVVMPSLHVIRGVLMCDLWAFVAMT